MPQEQERKQAEKREAERRADAEQAEATAKGEKLKEEMDEIDSVLEENAEEFVKSYVQKGGE